MLQATILKTGHFSFIFKSVSLKWSLFYKDKIITISTKLGISIAEKNLWAQFHSTVEKIMYSRRELNMNRMWQMNIQ